MGTLVRRITGSSLLVEEVGDGGGCRWEALGCDVAECRGGGSLAERLRCCRSGTGGCFAGGLPSRVGEGGSGAGTVDLLERLWEVEEGERLLSGSPSSIGDAGRGRGWARVTNKLNTAAENRDKGQYMWVIGSRKNTILIGMRTRKS